MNNKSLNGKTTVLISDQALSKLKQIKTKLEFHSISEVVNFLINLHENREYK